MSVNNYNYSSPNDLQDFESSAIYLDFSLEDAVEECLLKWNDDIESFFQEVPEFSIHSLEADSEIIESDESEEEEAETELEGEAEEVRGASNEEFLGYSLEKEQEYEENSDLSAHVYNLLNIYLSPLFGLQSAFLQSA